MQLWTFVYMFLFECLFSILLAICLGVVLLSHMETLCLAFKEAAKLFSNMATSFYILPTSNVCVSISPYPHQHLLLFAFSIIAIIVSMNWYLIVVLICISLVLSIFPCAYWSFAYILQRNVYSDKKKKSLPIFNWLFLHCKSSLCVLNKSPILGTFPVMWIVFSLSWWYCLQHESLKFWCIPIYWYFCHLCFWSSTEVIIA